MYCGRKLLFPKPRGSNPSGVGATPGGLGDRLTLDAADADRDLGQRRETILELLQRLASDQSIQGEDGSIAEHEVFVHGIDYSGMNLVRLVITATVSAISLAVAVRSERLMTSTWVCI